MGGITRIGDSYSCGDIQSVGSGNVFVNGMPVARGGDATAGHGCFPGTVATTTVSTVSANGIPVVILGSPNVPHSCPDNGTHSGSVAVSSPDVFAES